MPAVPKTAKILDLVLKSVSSDMREPLVPMVFPLLGSRVSDAEFLYPDNTYRELCGQMVHLVADSGANKGQFGTLVERINGDLRAHDEEEMLESVAWKKTIKQDTTHGRLVK
ncbi:MAG: hypothetical protein ACI4V5_05550 [Prevotella sp.]